MHKRSMKALANKDTEIEVNQVVMCDGSSLWGSSLWGSERGYKIKVKLIRLEYDDELGEPYILLYVYHNGPWQIYTDTGFAIGISNILSQKLGAPVKVNFTEQGMQNDGVAAMETEDRGSFRALKNYIFGKKA